MKGREQPGDPCPVCGRPMRWIERSPGNETIPETPDLPLSPGCTFCLDVPDE